jgi:hypothetical protein
MKAKVALAEQEYPLEGVETFVIEGDVHLIIAGRQDIALVNYVQVADLFGRDNRAVSCGFCEWSLTEIILGG